MTLEVSLRPTLRMAALYAANRGAESLFGVSALRVTITDLGLIRGIKSDRLVQA